MRSGRQEIDYNYDRPQHVNNNSASYRSLINAGPGKCITWVAIAPSTLPDGGYGLFATKNLLEGTHPCTYGHCFGQEINHEDHNDTIYDDGKYISIGNRDKDYGCWCNDPLDQALVNCTIVHDGAKHQLRIRWDVTAGEELFVDYGIDFWKKHYWKNPQAVRKRFPSIVPTYPAPAEGESHRPRENLSEDLLKYPKNFEQVKTKPWTAPQARKRKTTHSSEGAKRIARILCSRYAMDKLTSMGKIDAQCDDIAANIRSLREQMQPVTKGGRRTRVQFKDDIERMAELKNQQTRVKNAKSKRGVKRDNPTEKQARLRPDWPLFEKAIKAELRQIQHEEKAHELNVISRAEYCQSSGSLMALLTSIKPG
jgi:hypothetical protein